MPGKSVPAKDNLIFDSKVLSRTHAEIWLDDGKVGDMLLILSSHTVLKVFIKDTKSSNGTFVNDNRLSASGEDSGPYELHTGDKLCLGVDVTENNVTAHKCVLLDVEIVIPEAPVAAPKEETREDLEIKPPSVLVDEVRSCCALFYRHVIHGRSSFSEPTGASGL